MSERLRQGLQQRNKREKKWQTPEGEGPSREGRTLADSQPQGGNSKRTGSPRVPWRTLERVKVNLRVRTQWGPPGNTPWVTGRADTRRQRRDVQPGTDQRTVPDPNGETKPSFRSRTSSPRPSRGDPIAKVGNPSGEKKPQEPVHQEPEVGRMAGRKQKKTPAQL